MYATVHTSARSLGLVEDDLSLSCIVNILGMTRQDIGGLEGDQAFDHEHAPRTQLVDNAVAKRSDDRTYALEGNRRLNRRRGEPLTECFPRTMRK